MDHSLYDTAKRVIDEQSDAIEALKRENAELRELAKTAWRCIHSGPSCFDCNLIGGCTLLSAMRELGIEVGR